MFYEKKTDSSEGVKLLQNIKKQINPQEKENLDKIISDEELGRVVHQLQKNKTPGPDGLPAEFYQEYWHLFDDLYLDFVMR